MCLRVLAIASPCSWQNAISCSPLEFFAVGPCGPKVRTVVLVRVPTSALKSPAKISVNFFWTKVRMRCREDKKSCCTCAAALALGAYAAKSANPSLL